MIPFNDAIIIVIAGILLLLSAGLIGYIVCAKGWHNKCCQCKCCTKNVSESQKNLYGKKSSETVQSGTGDSKDPSQIPAHHEPVHQPHGVLNINPRSVPYHDGINVHPHAHPHAHPHPHPHHNMNMNGYMTHSNRERGRSAATNRYQPPIGPSDHNMQHRQPLPHRVQSRNVGDNQQPDQPQLGNSTHTSFQNNPDHMVMQFQNNPNGANASMTNFSNNRPSSSYTQTAVNGRLYHHNAGDSGSHKNGITNYNPAIPTTNGTYIDIHKSYPGTLFFTFL